MLLHLGKSHAIYSHRLSMGMFENNFVDEGNKRLFAFSFFQLEGAELLQRPMKQGHFIFYNFP
jgi:hypothetical protein